jgi:hypothetical protein
MTVKSNLTNKQLSAMGIKTTDNGSNGNLNEPDIELKHKKKRKFNEPK